MANVVKIDTTHVDQRIHSVTVFQANSAEINRRFHVPLNKGQNEIEISKLPSVLDSDSIRVDGLGSSAIIFDVIYHPPPPVSALDTAGHDSALAALNTQKSKIKEERDILHFQAKTLEDYAKKMSAEYGVDVAKLETFLDGYFKRKQKLNDQTRECEDQLKVVEKQIKDEMASLNADEEGRKRSVRVTVIVLAEEDGEVELSLSYVVINASWSPQYDVRAMITTPSESSKTPTSPTVSLHYRASISQSTGEDWKGTELTLSTASPQIGSAVPALKPYWIGQVQPSWTAHGGHQEYSRMRSAPPQLMKMVEAVASEGAVSATFRIEGLSTIPSDTADASQTHKVSIAVIDLTAELEWVSVPRELPSAFLQARIKNASEYLLLPGPANIFMDNNFVSKSAISHVSPAESFSCSLGVDPQLRVTYHPVQKKTKAAGSVLLLSNKTLSQSFNQRISVKNTRRSPVQKLIIRDQVPVTTDARIKVNLVEPAQLSVPGGKEATISKGVVARWVQKDDDVDPVVSSTSTPGAGETGEGILEWVCRMEAGQSLDVNLAWEVIAPQGLSWGKQ